jgi:hypothetical protein
MQFEQQPSGSRESSRHGQQELHLRTQPLHRAVLDVPQFPFQVHEGHRGSLPLGGLGSQVARNR